MGYIFALITIVVYVLYIAMLLRMFAPEWRPKGIVLLFASGVYAVTDWPMNQLRRLIPPVRVGNVALDTGFLILIVLLSLLLSIMMRMTAAFS